MDTQTKNQVAGIIDRARRLKAEKEQKLMQVRQAAELSLAPNLRTPNAIDAQFAAEWEKESKAFYEKFEALKKDFDTLAAKLNQGLRQLDMQNTLAGYLAPDSPGVNSGDLYRARQHIAGLSLNPLYDFYVLAIGVNNPACQLVAEERFREIVGNGVSENQKDDRNQFERAIVMAQNFRRDAANIQLKKTQDEVGQALGTMQYEILQVDQVERTKKLSEDPRYSQI